MATGQATSMIVRRTRRVLLAAGVLAFALGWRSAALGQSADPTADLLTYPVVKQVIEEGLAEGDCKVTLPQLLAVRGRDGVMSDYLYPGDLDESLPHDHVFELQARLTMLRTVLFTSDRDRAELAAMFELAEASLERILELELAAGRAADEESRSELLDQQSAQERALWNALFAGLSDRDARLGRRFGGFLKYSPTTNAWTPETKRLPDQFERQVVRALGLTLTGPDGATVRYISNLNRRRIQKLLNPPPMDQWPWIDQCTLSSTAPPSILVEFGSRYFFLVEGAGPPRTFTKLLNLEERVMAIPNP